MASVLIDDMFWLIFFFLLWPSLVNVPHHDRMKKKKKKKEKKKKKKNNNQKKKKKRFQVKICIRKFLFFSRVAAMPKIGQRTGQTADTRQS